MAAVGLFVPEGSQGGTALGRGSAVPLSCCGALVRRGRSA